MSDEDGDTGASAQTTPFTVIQLPTLSMAAVIQLILRPAVPPLFLNTLINWFE